MALGLGEEQIEHYEEETESLSAAMDGAGERDLVIMLALGGAAPIQEQLESLTD